MKTRSIFLLALVTAVAVIAALLSGGYNQGAAPIARAGDKVFPGLEDKVNQIAVITLRQGDASLTVRREGDRWAIEEKFGYPARIGRIRAATLDLARLTYEAPKTDNSERFERLHVGDPLAPEAKGKLLQLEDADGNLLASLILGKEKSGVVSVEGGGEGMYIRLPEGERAWLVRGKIELASDPMRWIDKTILEIPESRVAWMTVTDPDGGQVVVEREAAEAAADEAAPDMSPDMSGQGAETPVSFMVRTLPEGETLKNQWSVNNIGGAFRSLDIQDVAPAASLAEAEGPRFTYEMVTIDGLILRGSLHDVRTVNWLTLSADTTDEASPEVQEEAIRLNARFEGWAFNLVSYRATPFKTTMDDLIGTPEDGISLLRPEMPFVPPSAP